MALARARRNETGLNYWPGFVDALSTLVLSIVFLLSVFLVVQFFLSQEVTGKDKALEQLNAKIAQLNELLSLEKLGKLSLDDQVSQLKAGLASAESERDRMKGLYEGLANAGNDAQGKTTELGKALDSEKAVSARALAHMEAEGIGMRRILTADAIQNAMVVHAAFGGSTNLLLHVPAIAHAAGLARPTVEDWIAAGRPRVDTIVAFGLTQAQLIAIASMLVSLWFLVYLLTRMNNVPGRGTAGIELPAGASTGAPAGEAAPAAAEPATVPAAEVPTPTSPAEPTAPATPRGSSGEPAP